MVLSHPKAKQPIIGLAIMDDQSSITLMSPHAVQKMGLPPDALRNDSLATVTVQGTSTDDPCKIATGLSIAPLHAPKRKIQLPSTFIQREIPSASREVPTRDEDKNKDRFTVLKTRRR